MNRLIATLAFALSASPAFSQDLRFESVITDSGYVQYMAESACISNKNGAFDPKKNLAEELKRMQEQARTVSETLDRKYGLDKLSETEKKRMVAYFKSQPGTHQRVILRIREISPSCNTNLPTHLAEIMSRDQFIAYIAELLCLKQTQPSLSVLPGNARFAALSDNDKNRIADAYLITPSGYSDIRSRMKTLDARCKYVSP